MDEAVAKSKKTLIFKIINIVLVVGFGIFLVIFLLRGISFTDIKNAIVNSYKPTLIAAFVIVFVSDIFRAYRIQLLVGTSKIRLLDMFFIALIRNAFTMVLPARTGEISYVYVLTKKFKFPVEVGISTLALVMVFDLAIVFSLIVIAIIIVWITIGFGSLAISSWPVILIAAVLLIASLLLLFYLSAIIRFLINLLNKMILKTRAKRNKAINYIYTKLIDINESIEEIKQRKIYGKVYFYSIICRVLKFGAYYMVIHAILQPMGYGFLSLNFWIIFLATVVAEISAVLPTHALAGFGTYEGAFALAFVALGFPVSLSKIVGFSYHITMLSFSVILGVISMIIISLPFYKVKTPQV
ncbi:MAG: lysylphosphatidylglycerol synthase transmembrane domain-containing protein [Actinobacteria bacterium]|nr:lysylphosphatidylglycerol synthase transmembrane domain-containing protein [Actinomycetota bacterium]